MFLCSYCDFSNTPRFCEVIQPSTETHPDINLQCRGERLNENTEKLEHTLFNFSAIPSDVITNYTIIPIEKSNTIVLQSWSNPANFKNSETLDVFMIFLKLVGLGNFPMNNITLRLFFDVVGWYSLQTTCSMTYSEESEMFWRTGFQLFHDKFINSMSGFKNKGHANENVCTSGIYDPQQSKINFAVPDLNCISECENIIPSYKMTPGLIYPLLNTLT